jgi:NAD(P)H-quinone oxidoreductase subunit 5
LALIYGEYRTFELVTLFAAIDAQLGSVAVETNLACFLLMLAAVIKSAQLPFHIWLPQTMETPTPVSALMHAGIVNAGGYLMIRTSPLISLTPWVLTTLAIIGATTAVYAAVVMLTQTSIKKSLAYSTIAQMGFMMLQCGLGAFAAAMLHILAHSLYKAHAFLSSGSVVAHAASTRGAQMANQAVAWHKLALIGLGLVVVLASAMAVWGINPAAKPGGLLLSALLCIALTNWLRQVMKTGNRQVLLAASSAAAMLCFVYVTSFVAIDKYLAVSVSASHVTVTGGLTAVIALLGFSALLLVGFKLIEAVRPSWINVCYVHASHGFYLHNAARRVFGRLASS